ncbi:MAG: cation:proton antiporter [Pseudomonadota bacterium]
MLRSLTRAPLLLSVVGLLLHYGLAGLNSLPGLGLALSAPAVWAFLATLALSALVFSASIQFRVSRLGIQCPVSFRLCFGGAPIFLIACGLCAFILMPQLSLSAAFLLGGILMLNGSAFDRRAIVNTPAPALVKAGVQFESAVVLSLGLPIAVLLAGGATNAVAGEGALAPLLRASLSVLAAFAIGGTFGLVAALIGNRFRRGHGFAVSIVAVLIAVPATWLLGGHPIVAAGATGLIWAEQARTPHQPRLRHRLRTERLVMPLTYFLVGFVLGPRLFNADLLMITFALAMVTIMRVLPRLAALQSATLPRQAQFFLSWFGGTPGVASALFLVTLLDQSNLMDQELILTLGTVCVVTGIFTARLTAQPLAHHYLRGMGVVREREFMA